METNGETDKIEVSDPEVEMLIYNRDEDGYNYRERRHGDWTKNYEFYRDKVITNRLTQRQSVNVPLMKQTIRTILKDIDDMPKLYFENKDNDKDAEIVKNAYWEWTEEQNKLELQDIVDKRQVLLFGRSFIQIQIKDGRIFITLQDPMDILVSRIIDPFDINTSRFLIHQHIFIPLSTLKNDENLNQEAVKDLETWYKSEAGIVKVQDNRDQLQEKNQKMSDMGVQDVDSPILGETYVETELHFVWRDDEKDADGNVMESQIFLYMLAEDRKILFKKPLEEVIGETKDHFWRSHYPYVTWGDDLEKQDFWSDGVADIVRTPNEVANTWFSQLVENRTLKNFNMNLYNSNIEGFSPQTWEPIPWGMYAVPLPDGGKMQEHFQQMQVADLSDEFDEMTFVIEMIAKATGATDTQQGVQTERQVTLGEVQLALGEAKERTKGISKFYVPARKELGMLFTKMMEAGYDRLDIITLEKKGRNTSKVYSRDIAPKDWLTEKGYTVKVWSQDEKEAKDTESLNKMNAVKANMPDNPVVDDQYKRELLQFGGFDPDKINEAMQFEDAKRQAQMAAMAQGIIAPPQAGGQQSASPAPQLAPQRQQQKGVM